MMAVMTAADIHICLLNFISILRGTPVNMEGQVVCIEVLVAHRDCHKAYNNSSLFDFSPSATPQWRPIVPFRFSATSLLYPSFQLPRSLGPAGPCYRYRDVVGMGV